MPANTGAHDKGQDRLVLMLDLLHDCAASGPGEQADRIREAAALLDSGRMEQQASTFLEVVEPMLRAGAYESAVLALFDREVSYMLSRGAGGTCLASVVRADCGEDVTAEGTMPALALLCAYLAALVEQSGTGARPVQPGRDLRLN